MRTYTHGIIGYLLYLKTTAQQKKLAILGAILPDVLLGIGFIFHYMGKSAAAQAGHNIFHRSVLQTLTELFHSFVLIIPLGVLAYFFYKKALPLFIGMFSHAVLDILTHQKWAYNHLYPLPIPPFISPISYTSLWFTIIEHMGVLLFIIWIWHKTYNNKKSHKQKKNNPKHKITKH